MHQKWIAFSPPSNPPANPPPPFPGGRIRFGPAEFAAGDNAVPLFQPPATDLPHHPHRPLSPIRLPHDSE